MSSDAERRAERYATDVQQWLVLDGDRLHVAAVVLAVTAAPVTAVAWSGALDLRSLSPLYYVLQALLGGNLTLVTVVVSINQLVVSSQLVSAGEAREQLDQAVEFREHVEELADRQLAPVEPDAFLDVLVEAAHVELDRLDDERTSASGNLRDALDEFVLPLEQHLDYVDALLDRSGTDVFTALSTVLDTDYARELHRGQRLLADYGDDLPADAEDAVDRLLADLQYLDVARQFFKTIYMQEELSYFSRVLVYVGVVSTVVVLLSLVVAGVETPPGFSWWTVRVALPVGVTAGLAPLSVLVSFVLRVATVTQLTAAVTPFIQLE